MWRVALLLVVVGLGGPACGQTGGPAFLTAAGQQVYQRYLNFNLPRALAVSPAGGYGAYGGVGTIEAARDKAMQSCAAKTPSGCALYAENLETVWPSARRPPPPPAPAAPLITGPGYNFIADARYIWHGPAAARGMYVWSDGYGGPVSDARGVQPQSHVRAFNNAGFDVVRFERDPHQDHQRDLMAANLAAGLTALRRQGWKVIVAGGQSRGAWNSLQTLAAPGVADVVIAVSPGAHGTDSGNMVTRQETDLWQLLHDARSPTTRVAFVQFADDPYSAMPERRVALVDAQLRPRVGQVLVIDRPAGITGHGGGASYAFAARYGDCLVHFATDASPPSACGAP
jgi:hypothetical protein